MLLYYKENSLNTREMRKFAITNKEADSATLVFGINHFFTNGVELMSPNMYVYSMKHFRNAELKRGDLSRRY